MKTKYDKKLLKTLDKVVEFTNELDTLRVKLESFKEENVDIKEDTETIMTYMLRYMELDVLLSNLSDKTRKLMTKRYNTLNNAD